MAFVLPVVEEMQYEGWNQWRQLEEDVWREEAALRREGWSEQRWRRWQRILLEEVATRRAWWELLQRWCATRWGRVMGGRDWREEAVWEAARDEEAARRLWWNWDVRLLHGLGADPADWLQRWSSNLCEMGLGNEVEVMERSRS